MRKTNISKFLKSHRVKGNPEMLFGRRELFLFLLLSLEESFELALEGEREQGNGGWKGKLWTELGTSCVQERWEMEERAGMLVLG